MHDSLAFVVFGFTYVALSVGKIPGLRVDRASIALLGAVACLAFGLISFDEAVSTKTIDYPTIALLFGMMLLVGVLDSSGGFSLLTRWVQVRSANGLLALTVVLSGALAALFTNDIICLCITPVVLAIARERGWNPLPQLIAIATASNVGSVATITGSPQNVYVGLRSGLSFGAFALRLIPVAVVGLLLTYAAVRLLYRRELATNTAPIPSPAVPQSNRWRLGVSSVLTIAALAGFIIGYPLALVALIAGVLALVLSRMDPTEAFKRVDWGLLTMFASLFIVVRVFQLHGGADWKWDSSGGGTSVFSLTVLTAFLSNIVSNVPAVMILAPFAQTGFPTAPSTGWLTLAMASTLAGNLTVLGSVAHIIVFEIGRRDGVVVSFWDYVKVGAPLGVLTLALGVVWLSL